MPHVDTDSVVKIGDDTSEPDIFKPSYMFDVSHLQNIGIRLLILETKLLSYRFSNNTTEEKDRPWLVLRSKLLKSTFELYEVLSVGPEQNSIGVLRVVGLLEWRWR